MLKALRALHAALRKEKREQFDRRVSFGDLLTDRWENARDYGFGEGTSCYDNVLIIGDVKVGKHTWIGPNVILDGSGGLVIGDHCAISAGVQIYSHSSVDKYTVRGELPIARGPTTIGSDVFIGPNSVIAMGVIIGDHAVIGTLSFVDRDIPPAMKAWGCPARVTGVVDDP